MGHVGEGCREEGPGGLEGWEAVSDIVGVWWGDGSIGGLEFFLLRRSSV